MIDQPPQTMPSPVSTGPLVCPKCGGNTESSAEMDGTRICYRCAFKPTGERQPPEGAAMNEPPEARIGGLTRDSWRELLFPYTPGFERYQNDKRRDALLDAAFSAAELRAERDALKAENEKLREALLNRPWRIE